GGTVSCSMSVTNPWRYLRATSSDSCSVSVAMGDPSARRRGFPQVRAQFGEGLAAVLQVGERDVLGRAPDARVDSLPGRAHAAERLEVAAAVGGAALRDGDRSLERIENLGGADRPRRAGERVAAL